MIRGIRTGAAAVVLGGMVGFAMGDVVNNGAGLYEEFVVDVSGLEFNGELGDPLNTVIQANGFPVAEYMRVAAVRWDVNISTMPTSWLSEASLQISVEGNSGFTLTPGDGDDFSGIGSYSSGWVDVGSLGASMWVGTDNTIRIELFDSNSAPGLDAFFGAGSTVTLGLQIPSPSGAVVLMIGGLAGARRRR